MYFKLIIYVAMISLSHSLDFPMSPSQTFSMLMNCTEDEIDKNAASFLFNEDSVASKLTYLIITNAKGNMSKELTYQQARQVNMNIRLPIYFYIPGWTSGPQGNNTNSLASAVMKEGPCTFVAVNWTYYSYKGYLQSAQSTKNVGKSIAAFIHDFIKNDLKYMKNIHLFGHSLGAHVAGFTGKALQQMTGHKVGMLMAMDAAAPLFEFPVLFSPKDRVYRTDATFVMAVHTNIHVYGFAKPFGHADFYVHDGGPVQPGCPEFNINILKSIKDTISCSHNAAVNYIQESAYRDFPALKCPNKSQYRKGACNNNKKVLMSIWTPPSTRGIYYLEVDQAEPHMTFFDKIKQFFSKILPFV